jgi:hypothetical protein
VALCLQEGQKSLRKLVSELLRTMLSLSAEHPSCLLSKGVNLMLDQVTLSIVIIGKLQFSMQANSVAKSQID